MNDLLERVAVLILNYNSATLAMNSVNALLNLYKNMCVIVVDNCSTDDSYKTISVAYNNVNNVSVVLNKINRGYACGNNFGLKFIRENFPEKKHVIVMNPDIIINDINTIIKLQKFLDSHDDFSIVSTQYIFNGLWRGFSDFGWKFPSKKTLFWSGTLAGKLLLDDVNDRYSLIEIDSKDLYTPVDIVSGCFFMAKIDDLKQVGYFDERTFLYFEEAILSAKLKKIKKKEAILLNQFVYHNHQAKDKILFEYIKKLFDRKCFHESKMIYINNYSDIKGISLFLCNMINNIDFQIKKMIFNVLLLVKH